MRIGMIMDAPFPPDTRVENEARALQEAGHEIFLFTIAYRGEELRSEHNGVTIFRMPAGRLLYKLSALVYTVPFFRWSVGPHLRRFIRSTGVEILHVHDMVIADAVFRENRRFGLPVILDLHENRPEILKHYHHVNRIPGKWLIYPERWKRVQHRLMEQADRIVLVTEEACRAAEEDGIPAGKMIDLPNVVRLEGTGWGKPEQSGREEAAPPGSETGREGVSPGGSVNRQMADADADADAGGMHRFTLLYIGDTSLRRGTATAIEAVGLLAGEIPGLELRLVGSSSQDRWLHRLVREKGLEGQVKFEGWQPPERLPVYARNADLCLSPLLRNPHHDTTFANKLFQYMAAGRALVVSNCPAQARLVREEHCGLVHRAGDAEDLAERIRWLWRQPQRREEMGRNGRQAVLKRWNWSVTGSRLVHLYEAVERERLTGAGPLRPHTTGE